LVWDNIKISAMCHSCTCTTEMDVKESKGQNTELLHMTIMWQQVYTLV